MKLKDVGGIFRSCRILEGTEKYTKGNHATPQSRADLDEIPYLNFHILQQIL